MHILILPSWYPSKGNSIRGSFFKEQAEALQKAGNKVGVIYPEARILRLNKEYTFKDLGIKSRVVNNILTYRSVFFGKIPGRSYWRERFLWSADAVSIFKKYILVEGMPDIIHVHSALNGGLVALKIGKKHGIPFVVTEHSSGFYQDYFNKSDKKLLRKIYSKSARNITVSPVLAETVNTYLDSNFTFEWIPNFVNSMFINNNKRKQIDGFVFLSVGALNENKNHSDLINAFIGIFRNKINIKLRIAGSGKLKSKLLSLIESENMGEQISLLGKVERVNIVDEYKNADCLVHTSKYETFGVVIIEALASGLPVISSVCGGPEYIVNKGNGVLFPIGNIEELQKQMLFMWRNKGKYSPELIKRDCFNKFGEKTLVNTLLGMYYKILDNNN